MKFYDFKKINLDNYGNYDTNQLTDSILESVERQKLDMDPDQLSGLLVDSIDAHSMKLTSHFHLYLPQSMQQSVDSLTDPYNIPVLTHHDLQTDAIGRVSSGRYVNTFDTFKSGMFNQEVTALLGLSGDTKDLYKKLRKYNSILLGNGNLGAGRLETVSNVVDADAVTKILNKTYDTISMGYETDTLICSEDGLPYYESEFVAGKDYGHGPVYIIFGKLRYFEKSYVNAPADENAGNTSYLRIHNKDNAKKDNVDVKYLVDSGCAGSCEVNFTFNDSINKQQTDGALMKIKEFKKLGDTLYTKVLEMLSEDSRLTLDEVKALDDDAFVGAKRLVLAHSEDAINASVSIITDEIEDCDEKTELLDFLSVRLEDVKASEKANKDEDKNDSKVNELKFNFTDEKWTLSDEKEDNEKALLAVLVTKYSDNKEDATEMINSILSEKEFKDELVTELATDELADVMTRIDNYKYESGVQQAKYSALVQTADSLTSDLKDNYIEKLLSFRTKEDPSLDSDELKTQFKERSLESLKSTYEDMINIFATSDESTEGLDDDGNKLDADKGAKEMTDEEIKVLKDEQLVNYKAIRSINVVAASKFMADSTKRINQLIEDSKQDKN